MADRLKGKRAFITAAGQGMGRAAAVAFAREGAQVWATDVNANAAQDARRHARHHDARARRDRRGGGRARRGARRATSTCCSTAPASCITARSWTAREADWDRSFDLNVKSMYRVTRAFLPGMLKQGKGSIINMSSIASSVRGPAEPLRLRHHQGRGDRAHQGDRRRLREAGHPLQRHRARARSTRRRCRSASTPSPTRSQARKDFIARQPMGRLGTVDDIIPMLVYLASDESLFATGVAYSVDGGMTI